MTSSSSSDTSHSWGQLGVWLWGLEAEACRLKMAKHNSQGKWMNKHTVWFHLKNTRFTAHSFQSNKQNTAKHVTRWISTKQRSLWVLSYILEKFGDSPCSSLMVLCTRGVHTGGDDTLMPPLGRVDSSEEVLTRIWTVSIGGMIPRLTTSTVLSRSSSITTCPVTSDLISIQAPKPINLEVSYE